MWLTPLGWKRELGLGSLGLPRRTWRIGSSEHPPCASMERARRGRGGIRNRSALRELPVSLQDGYIRRKRRWHRADHMTPWASYGVSLSLDLPLQNGNNDYLF